MVLGLSSSSDIKIKLGTEKDCIQSVTVEISSARVKNNIEKAFKSVQGQAKLPGFRAGKVTMDMVKKNFKDTAYARAQDTLLREGVVEAIQAKKIKAVQSPVIQSTKFDPEKSFQFEFKVEVAPTFKLTAYKGIKITQKDNSVSNENVEKKLNEVRDGNAKLIESKSQSVGKADFAVINYEGFIDGKPIPGTKTENFLMDIAAPQTISGLAEGLIGEKIGVDKDINVTFPKDSPAKDLAGKEAIFKVHVVAIKEKKLPNLDDEFAKDLGLESIDALRNRIQSNMEAEAAQKTRRHLENQLIDKLVTENSFSVPKGLIEQQSQTLIQRQKHRLSQQGISKETDQNKILDGLKPEIAKQAEREVRLAYILNAISDQEKISIPEAEVNQKIDDILGQSKPEERAHMEKILKGAYKNQVASEMKDTKIFDWLISHAKIKKEKEK